MITCKLTIHSVSVLLILENSIRAGCIVFERLTSNLCYLCCTTELSSSCWYFSLSLLFFSFSVKKFILLNRTELIIFVAQLNCHVHAGISLYLYHFSLFLLYQFIPVTRTELVIYVAQLNCHVHGGISRYLCHFSLCLLYQFIPVTQTKYR